MYFSYTYTFSSFACAHMRKSLTKTYRTHEMHLIYQRLCKFISKKNWEGEEKKRRLRDMFTVFAWLGYLRNAV